MGCDVERGDVLAVQDEFSGFAGARPVVDGVEGFAGEWCVFCLAEVQLLLFEDGSFDFSGVSDGFPD